MIQVCALPLAYYLKHQAAIPWPTVHECNTLTFKEEGSRHREAVLHCKDAGALEDDGFVTFPYALDTGRRLDYQLISNAGGIPLPEVHFAKRSGESLLDGKQPQIVLVVRAVAARTGAPLTAIKPVVSNPFCVATRRVKGAMKVDIPSMDQEVWHQHLRRVSQTSHPCVCHPAVRAARRAQSAVATYPAPQMLQLWYGSAGRDATRDHMRRSVCWCTLAMHAYASCTSCTSTWGRAAA
jgi:hypothetical protein